MSGEFSAFTAAALGIALSPVPFVLVGALQGDLAAFFLLRGLLDTLT